ncbi:MAG: hypothetical protein H6Q74_367 [Firmicutes bacterium]|nr:hypothetical protein [Bacillota bacterium]
MFPGFDSFGKTLMLIGGIIFLAGILMHFSGKMPWLGKLPGDIHIERDSFGVYFPIATSILLSIVLTILLNLFDRR